MFLLHIRALLVAYRGQTTQRSRASPANQSSPTWPWASGIPLSRIGDPPWAKPQMPGTLAPRSANRSHRLAVNMTHQTAIHVHSN